MPGSGAFLLTADALAGSGDVAGLLGEQEASPGGEQEPLAGRSSWDPVLTDCAGLLLACALLEAARLPATAP